MTAANSIEPAMKGAGGVEGVSIRVRGLVQGVGFRPTVWRLAQALRLKGHVMNDSEGVLIHAYGSPAALRRFEAALVTEAPPLARVDRIETSPLAAPRAPADFRIAPSRSGAVATGVVPDAATCPACLADIRDPSNRHYRYPFTNCTHCGPRLSIVSAIPYDRAATSMAQFSMCPDCLGEYRDPADRRFHAQPNACPVCGPKAWLEGPDGQPMSVAPHRDAIEAAAALIRSGALVAIKGLGGFHLACDALNAKAVARLRQRKRRSDKPFAMMARDAAVIERYAALSDMERALLCSPAAPIVLLDRKSHALTLAPDVAPGQTTLGFMLAYTPLHHLLLEGNDEPLVMTSANMSEEPQCIANEDARSRLSGIADAFLMHDRDIVNRLDDSVVRVMAGKPRLLRRARGFAPSPLPLPKGFEAAQRVLAMGAELKSTFCLLGKGNAIVSQHIGDLEDSATHSDYRANLALYRELFRFKPERVAVDAHPDYHSTSLGRLVAQENAAPLEPVHHHHAHIAAVLAEHAVALEGASVIGIALDGLGLGENGELWGGEILLADYKAAHRVASFAPIPLIGGAMAMREPWRNALAHLDACLGWRTVEQRYGDLDAIKRLQQKPVATALRMVAQGINAPPCSSAGRLFDAVAAMLGICFERVSYEGQAAIELEALATSGECSESEGYRGALIDGTPARLDFAPLWGALLDDQASGTKPARIAARFHLGLGQTLAETATKLARRHGLDTVVLCGGVFQNKLLLEKTIEALCARGLAPLSPSLFPSGDGAISLGQATIAAARGLRDFG